MMTTKKVIFTIGVSASGKSTWALNTQDTDPQGVAVVCRDNIRHAIAFDRCQNRGYSPNFNITHLWTVWNWKWEKEVTDLWWKQFETKVSNSQLHTIICADTNLNRARLDEMKNRMIREYSITQFEEKVFDVSLEEAWKRDAARSDGVGEAVIYKQWVQFNEQYGKVYKSLPEKQKAVMVDIDGTLATMNGRSAFEWEKVGQDKVREEIRDMVNGFYSQGYVIIVMSGRDSVCREETERWLFDNEIKYNQLYMRAKSDMRKDSIIKEELFFQHVSNNYNVKLVIDDRTQVVTTWMRLGLKVANVGNPWERW